jgi:CRP-like cAMP-binding protein
MISRETLKQIIMLGYLSDSMLDQLVPIAELLQFEGEEFIFKQGEPANRFYMLLQGKVLLEQHITSKITVSLSAIKPGYSFGWSAMLDAETYSTNAICAEQSQLLSFRTGRLKTLFDSNHSLGYVITQRILHIIKKRYDVRTEQFIKVIEHHPDISILL